MRRESGNRLDPKAVVTSTAAIAAFAASLAAFHASTEGTSALVAFAAMAVEGACAAIGFRNGGSPAVGGAVPVACLALTALMTCLVMFYGVLYGLGAVGADDLGLLGALFDFDG